MISGVFLGSFGKRDESVNKVAAIAFAAAMACRVAETALEAE